MVFMRIHFYVSLVRISSCGYPYTALLSAVPKDFSQTKKYLISPKLFSKLVAKEHFLCDLINNVLWISKSKFIHMYHIYSAIMDNIGGPERVNNFFSNNVYSYLYHS